MQTIPYNTPYIKATKEATKTGVLSQGELYSRIASRYKEILDTSFALLYSRNDNVRLGAAKLLMDRIIPAKKAIEVSGANGEPIQFVLASGGYVPPSGVIDVTPEASDIGRPTEVQSIGMAQEGKKDNDSTNGDSKASLHAAGDLLAHTPDLRGSKGRSMERSSNALSHNT